jgi:hypothetical protein
VVVVERVKVHVEDLVRLAEPVPRAVVARRDVDRAAVPADVKKEEGGGGVWRRVDARKRLERVGRGFESLAAEGRREDRRHCGFLNDVVWQ